MVLPVRPSVARFADTGPLPRVLYCRMDQSRCRCLCDLEWELNFAGEAKLMSPKKTESWFLAAVFVFGLVCSPLLAAPSEDESLLEMYITGPIQRIGDSIINPMQDPPVLPINLPLVTRLARTGDIVIENNQAFPQWHAVFGALVPSMNFVHAGMVITGADLIAGAAEVKALDARAGAPAVYRMGKRDLAQAPKRVVELWGKAPAIDPQGLYVVAPEFLLEAKGSCIMAMEFHDYLMFPSDKACAKAFKLLRPQNINDSRRALIRKYLAYHIILRSGYDVAFRVDEIERGIVRDQAGNVKIDLSIPPVKLYCTEIAHRALRFADLPGAKLVRPFQQIPDLAIAPPKVPSWWNLPPNYGGSYVVADGFIAYCHYMYSNAKPVPLETARQRANLVKPIQHEWKRTLEQLTATFRRLQ